MTGNRSRWGRVAFSLGLVLLIGLLAAANAAADPFTVSIRAIPESLAPGAEGRIEVTISMTPGHYLYAERTGVTTEPVDGLTVGPAVRPEGERKNDPHLGLVTIYRESVTFRLPVTVAAGAVPGDRAVPLTVRFQGCTENLCFMPDRRTVTAGLTIRPATAEGADGSGALADEAFETGPSSGPAADSPLIDGPLMSPTVTPPRVGPSEAETSAIRRAAERFGIPGVLAAAFFWGLLASLTPCVYPMIPVTVSVIGAGSGGSAVRGFFLSLLYVLGMSLTYAAFGVAAAWTGNLFGAVAGHPAVRIGVAVLFLILALGLFDVIYIQMPASVTGRLSGARAAGAAGVLITGSAAGAIVGPCVGPLLVGLLVYIAGLGSKVMGFLIMWSFALGMGMLFVVIGTFSGAATALPRSGEWMVRLKQLFGVIMLAVALYTLRPLMPPDVFGLCLGAFLIGLGVFAGALDALTPDAAGARRLAKAAGLVLLVLGAGYVARFTLDRGAVPPGPPSAGSGITWHHDLPSALATARTEGRSVMIDFRADWCGACLKLERETFPNPAVVQAARRLVAVKIDCTDPDDPEVKRLQARYGVVGLPTIVFLTPDGTLLPERTITEYVSPAELARRLRGL